VRLFNAKLSNGYFNGLLPVEVKEILGASGKDLGSLCQEHFP
jgi:hypothetical protein